MHTPNCTSPAALWKWIIYLLCRSLSAVLHLNKQQCEVLTCTLWQVRCWRCGQQQGWTSRCRSCCRSCTSWAYGPGKGYHGFAFLHGSGTHLHCPHRSWKHYTPLYNHHHQRDPLPHLTGDKGAQQSHVVTFLCLFSHFVSNSSMNFYAVWSKKNSVLLTSMRLNIDGKNTTLCSSFIS